MIKPDSEIYPGISVLGDDAYSFGPFRLDRDGMRLLKNDSDVGLRHQAVRALCTLVEHAGLVVSYSDLALWAWELEHVDKEVMIVTIHEVRRSLGEYRNLIKTVKGGYCFEHPAYQDKAQSPLSQVRCSVALTTFEDNTINRDKAHLATGIFSELATTLSRIGSLRVIKATPQTMQFLTSAEADVKYLVEGSITGGGGRLKVNVQLLTLPNYTIVWSDTYPTSVEELQGLQSRIAGKITAAIKLKINLEETNKMFSEDNVDSETYELYLRGLHHWNRPTEVNLLRAIEYFRQATGRQPRFAKAFGALAHAYELLGLGGFMRPDYVMPQAKTAAMKCLELSPNSPEGLAGLAAVEAYHLWNWKNAENLLRRALTLNPNYDTGHHLYAMGCLMPQARLDEALREICVAQQLSPVSPFIVTCVGIVQFYARDYSQSIEQFDRALELQPHYHLAHWHRGWALAELGRFHEAISAVSTAVETSQRAPQVLAALGYVFALAGRVKDSRGIFSELKQVAADRYVSPYDLALVHIGLGDDAKALTLLKNAMDQRLPMLARLRVHPIFDRFRSNPKFLSLLNTMNLGTEPLLKKGKQPKRQKITTHQESKPRKK